MRAFEKSAEVIVAKKPDNAGGAKDEGVGLALWWSQRDRNYLRKRGGGRPLGPGMEGPRVEPGKPSSPGGGNRKERPCTRLPRSDSNRRILKTVRPVVWEGAAIPCSTRSSAAPTVRRTGRNTSSRPAARNGGEPSVPPARSGLRSPPSGRSGPAHPRRSRCCPSG